MTTTRKKVVETAGAGKDGEKSEDSEYPGKLVPILCIWYSITFRRKSVPMLLLFESSNEVNAIHPTFTQKLGLSIRPTDVETQKIDGTTLDTYRMIVAIFFITDKAN